MHSLSHCKMITIIRIYDGTFSGIDWLVYLTKQCWIFRALATIRISQSHFWLFRRSSLYPFISIFAFLTALVLSGWWWKILTWSQKLSWCWDGYACGCEFMGNSNKDISSQQRTPHPLSQTFSLWYFWMRWEYKAVSPVMQTCHPLHYTHAGQHISWSLMFRGKCWKKKRLRKVSFNKIFKDSIHSIQIIQLMI